METRVKITENESAEVERLFLQFNSYCEILGYLSKFGSVETDIFDKKWAEAVEINNKLVKLKSELDIKYHPEGEYKHFSFDFKKDEMIYE